MIISKHAVWRYRHRFFDIGPLWDSRLKIMDLYLRSRPAEIISTDPSRYERDIVKDASYRVCDGVVLAIRGDNIIATVYRQNDTTVRACR